MPDTATKTAPAPLKAQPTWTLHEFADPSTLPVKLSNKKIKYIRRHASTKTPEEIAANLRISVRDVQTVLKPSKGVSPAAKSGTRRGFERALHRGLILVSFLAPFVYLKNLYDFSLLPKMAFIQTGAAVLLILFLLGGLVRGSVRILKSPLNLPVLCFILWALISLGYAHNRYEGFLLWLHWAASASIFFIVLNGNLEIKTRGHLMAAIFASGFFCAVLGIIQHLFDVSWVPQAAPPAATFANKNMAVHFVVMALPLGTGFFVNNSGKMWDWVLAMMSGLMIVFLIYTQTRAGWLALSVEILLLAILFVRERLRHTDGLNWHRNKSLAVCVAVLMIFTMINIGPHGFKWNVGEVFERANISMETQIEPGTSIAWRLGTWQNTLAMIKEKFFIGLGIGNHKIFYPLYHRKVVPIESFDEYHQLVNVHNDYLQVFAELGVVGMIFLVWFGVALFRLIHDAVSPAHDRKVRFWAFGLFAGIAGVAVSAGFSFPFQRAVPPYVLMAYSGLLACFYAENHNAPHYILPRWAIGGAAAVALVVLSGLFRFHYFGIKNDRRLYYVTGQDFTKNWKGVIRIGEKATHDNLDRLRILPYMGRAYIELGMYREAIDVLNQVIAPYPNVINYLFHVGMAYGNIGDHERALEAFEKVLLIKPDFVRAHINIGRIYHLRKDLDRALASFKTAAKLDPNNSRTYFDIGVIAIAKGRYPEAAEAFEKALEINPEWAAAHKNLGLVYYQSLNKKKEGIQHFRKALALDPGISEAEELRKLVDQPG